MSLVVVDTNILFSALRAIQAYRLCKEVDESDSPFVALALELEAKLWTRDQPLTNALIRQGFNDFFD